MRRLINFKFDENQLISYLTSFVGNFTGKKIDEEERGFIAEFVMLKKDNYYEVKK